MMKIYTITVAIARKFQGPKFETNFTNGIGANRENKNLQNSITLMELCMNGRQFVKFIFVKL